MKKNKFIRGAVFLCGLALFLGSNPPILSQTDRLIVIVSKNSKIDSMPLSTLQNIFKGKIQTYRGIKIIPINYPRNSALNNLFISNYLYSSRREMEKYWQRYVLQGKGRPPRSLPNTNVIKRAVARVTRAISYIPAGDLDGSVKKVNIY